MTATGQEAPAAVPPGRGRVLAAVMLCTGLVALDATIVATAVPSIVQELNGFSQFPWLFSAYLLALAATAPLYGKLADVFGRKPVLFFGIGAFLAGSVLCGSAWNLTMLIAFRALQGIGAGAVQTLSLTIVSDLYPVAERARAQSMLSVVWGVCAVLGPTVGGWLAEYLSWRWIFFINVPLCAGAAWVLARHLHENVQRRRGHAFDFTGAALLMLGCSLVILGLLEGGVSWAWTSAPSLAVFGAGLVLLTAFVQVERRAPEPVLPLWVFRRRTLVGGNLAAIVVGAMVIGISSFVPTYVQGVLGAGALVAGLAFGPLSVGWPLAAASSGRLYLRFGFRDTALAGGVVAVAGAVLCARLGPSSSVADVGTACFVVGLGLGLIYGPTAVAVQSFVGWEERGVVTGAYVFSRSLGSALGAAVFGAVANSTLADRLAHPPRAVAGTLPEPGAATSLLLSGEGAGTAAVAYVRLALHDATHNVFVAMIFVALLGVAALLLMPRRAQLRQES
jgi:EmrB/QacA subfamily drug resistance transporter